jgi:hypothetical protein
MIQTSTLPRAALAAAFVLAVGLRLAAGADDGRNIRTGHTIPDEGYCDQPYIVVTKDGNWLCTLTTGRGQEGQKGQHVVATISADRGQTWSPLVDIEPADGPEASWVVPLVTPGGRVYAFYDYNGDRVATMPGGSKPIRADMLGWFVYKYSDDHGRTWSAKRQRLPMRLTACDRANQWQGKVQVFWGIDKPKIAGGDVYFAFTKLGRYMLDDGEGWLYRSDNLLTEPDVGKLRWELLPDGEHGVRGAAFGSVQEEHNLVPLGRSRLPGETSEAPLGKRGLPDSRLYCIYRTTTGYPCHSYSRDGGRTWTVPEQVTYEPGGRELKNPRACPKLWRTSDGRFLLWYHNHGGRSFESRNPAWIAGGTLRDGKMHWSQPEILLYDSTPATRMSYPDLVEQDGRYWVTETQKTTARVHEIDKGLLGGLWNQGRDKTVARRGLILDLDREQVRVGSAKLPGKLDLRQTGGLTLDVWLKLDDLAAGQVVLDNRDAAGNGFALTTAAEGAVRIELSDGKTKAAWDSDPGTLRRGTPHHVACIVDAGPRILSFVIDGVLCDGGAARQYGWGRYNGELTDVAGAGRLQLAPALKGKLDRVRVYSRYLRTSEAVANFHAGP